MPEGEWDGTVTIRGYGYEKAWLETVWLEYFTGGIPWVWEVELVYGYEPGKDPTDDISCRGDPTSELHYIGPSEGDDAASINRALGHSRVVDLGGPFPLKGWSTGTKE